MIVNRYFIIAFLLLVSATIFSQEKNIIRWDLSKGLPSEHILDIAQDATGYLWLATSKGLVKFDGKEFLDTKIKSVTCLLSHNDTLYIGTTEGLVVKTKASQHFYTSEKVLKVVPFKNKVFVSTASGFFQVKDTVLKPFRIHQNLDTSEINDIKFLENCVYVLSNTGLWKLDDVKKPKKIERMLSEPAVASFLWGNKLVVASQNNGLSIVSGGQIEERIKTLESVTSIKKIKNEIWIASNKDGIEVRSLPSFTFKQKINKYNYLETNAIYKVYRDFENSIWVASNEGLFHITDEKFKKQHFPTVHFEKLFVNNQNLSFAISQSKPIKLNADQNNISISFQSIDLSNTKPIRYRYKLNNQFTSWSSSNVLQLANLHPGNYSLTIQSKVGSTESATKKIVFKIDQPFFKKGGFIVSCVVFLLLLMYLSVSIYIKSIKNRNEKKIKALEVKNQLLTLEQKALRLQMNPHFIFNVLNGIKALGNSNKIEEFNKVVAQFSHLLRNILHNSRKEYVSLQEELEALKNYLELEQRMSSKTFTYNIELELHNIDLDEIQIPPMLIQPFVENSIKHGFKIHHQGTILISIKIIKNAIHFRIIDNGVGFFKSQNGKKDFKHNSVALEVCKDRIKGFSGINAFKIEEINEDNLPNGTKVWFKLPLKIDY